jgi:hypothetical protein
MPLFRSALQFTSLLAIATGAWAHSVNGAHFYPRSDQRVMLGLTIPLSKAAHPEESQPRLDLAFDHRNAHSSVAVDPHVRPSETPRHKSVIGFTLTSSPRFMINGKSLPEQGNRNHISTAGMIAIGVGVLVVSGGLALYAAANEASD